MTVRIDQTTPVSLYKKNQVNRKSESKGAVNVPKSKQTALTGKVKVDGVDAKQKVGRYKTAQQNTKKDLHQLDLSRGESSQPKALKNPKITDKKITEKEMKQAIDTYAAYTKKIRADRIKTRFDLLA